MAKKNTTKKRPTISRYAVISGSKISQSFHVDRIKGGGTEMRKMNCIELTGRLEEPIKGVSNLAISVFVHEDRPTTSGGPICVGSIISIKESVSLVTSMNPQEYSWLLTMIAANKLGACYFSSEQPAYGQAKVFNLSFDTELPPVEDR